MLRKALICIAVVLAVVVYYVFDPSVTPFPRCPFLTLTGLKCPGCGSQRAFHSLLHFDVLAALHYNFMAVVSVPLLIYLFAVEMLRTKNVDLYAKSHTPLFIKVLFLLIILWWVLRNIFGW